MKFWILLLILVVTDSAIAGPLPASVTATDGLADLTLFTDGDVNDSNANLIYDGTDYAYQIWIWYRKDGQTMETRMPTPDMATTPSTDQISLTWSNFDGELEITWNLFITDHGGTAELAQNMFVTALDSSNPEYQFYFYEDMDAAATGGNDVVTAIAPHTKFRATDGVHSVESVRGSIFWQNGVAAYPQLRSALDDNALLADLSALQSPFTGDYTNVTAPAPISDLQGSNHAFVASRTYLADNMADYIDCEDNQVQITDLNTVESFGVAQTDIPITYFDDNAGGVGGHVQFDIQVPAGVQRVMIDGGAIATFDPVGGVAGPRSYTYSTQGDNFPGTLPANAFEVGFRNEIYPNAGVFATGRTCLGMFRYRPASCKLLPSRQPPVAGLDLSLDVRMKNDNQLPGFIWGEISATASNFVGTVDITDGPTTQGIILGFTDQAGTPSFGPGDEGIYTVSIDGPAGPAQCTWATDTLFEDAFELW